MVNIAAVNIVAILGNEASILHKGAAAFITAVFVGGSVYARERLAYVRKMKEEK